MKLPFVPIARRDLKLISGGVEMPITLAMSAPYRPSKSPTIGPVGCMILDCDDPAFATEIAGQDEMEVLQLVLIHFDKLLENLSANNAGELRYADGSTFSQSNPSMFALYLSKAKTESS